jgi:translation elongation factor EF-1alpha
MEKNINEKFSHLNFGKAQCYSNKRTTVIGIIDASGSMSSCWPTLVTHWNTLVDDYKELIHTITFSYDASVKEGKYLSNSDVGGGTNIVSGFVKAYDKMLEIADKLGETDFTIIFVSDGDDGDMRTITKRIQNLTVPMNLRINLICVGIGSGFPTFVAMELREKYHSGLSSIPAVFLVNDFKTEILENFSIIKSSYLQSLSQLDISPAVLRFPWSKEKEESVYETSYFISDASEVFIKGEKVRLMSAFELSKKDLEEMFRSWTQELQLLSIKNNVRKEAQEAVDLMEFLFGVFTANDPNSNKKDKLTVLERLQQKEKSSNTHVLGNLIGECKRIRDGVSLKDLSAQEAANRLAIGTQVGKYHNKALQMKGLEGHEYNEFRKEFIDKLKETKLNPETTQEASFILLQNQKEILLEETLPQALLAADQYQLVEAFPLIGHTLMVQRTAASMINPFAINVLSIPRINKVCDTVSLVSKGNEMEISIGNDEEEKFNAVIPLFEASDNDLKPLVRSKLYHLLMTFNCMRNVDTFFFDAYYGLLANTFVRLLKYKDGSWRTEMINLVYNTTELIYGGLKFFEESLDLLLTNPQEAMVTEHKTLKYKCEDISKVILNLLVLFKRGKISESKSSEIIEFMIIEHLGRSIKGDTNLYEEYAGEDKLDDFSPKNFPGDSKRKDEQTTTDKKDNDNQTEQVVVDSVQVQDINSVNNPEMVVDINEYKPEQQPSDVIDINDFKPEVINKAPQTLDELTEEFIKTRKHLAFDSLKDLKQNLKKMFDEFTSNPNNTANLNIRLNRQTLNNISYRLNLTFFYRLQSYFISDTVPLNPEIFWIAINHNERFSSSNDRCTNPVDRDYKTIRHKLKNDYYKQKEKKDRQKEYDKFEKNIINQYLMDNQNAIKMMKDFKLSTELLKTHAGIDRLPKNVNIIVFGPQGYGKSTLVGRLMCDLNLIDKKLFENYARAYKTYFKKDNQPYEWISDVAADERCKSKTIYVNANHLQTENKFITLYDTPGKYKLFKSSISTMALVDHFFMVLECNIEKITAEKTFIINTIMYAYAYECRELYIVITKAEMCIDINNTIAEIVKLVESVVTKSNLSLKLHFIPVSSFTGNNIMKRASNDYPSLYEVINSLKPSEDKSGSSVPKILVTGTIGDQFSGRVIYGNVYGGAITAGQAFTVQPSNKKGKIQSLQCNYTDIDAAEPGMAVSIKLSESASALGVERGSILDCSNVSKSKTGVCSVKEVIMSIKYIGNSELKRLTCLMADFQFFHKNLQIVEIQSVKDKDGKELTELDKITSKQTAVIRLQPVNNTMYFENLWKSDSVVLRGKHYSIIGFGKIKDITYNK